MTPMNRLAKALAMTRSLVVETAAENSTRILKASYESWTHYVYSSSISTALVIKYKDNTNEGYRMVPGQIVAISPLIERSSVPAVLYRVDTRKKQFLNLTVAEAKRIIANSKKTTLFDLKKKKVNLFGLPEVVPNTNQNPTIQKPVVLKPAAPATKPPATTKPKYSYFIYTKARGFSVEFESSQEKFSVKRGSIFFISNRKSKGGYKATFYAGTYSEDAETISAIISEETKAKLLAGSSETTLEALQASIKNPTVLHTTKPRRLSDQEVQDTPMVNVSTDASIFKKYFGAGFKTRPAQKQDTPGVYVEGYWKAKKSEKSDLPWPEAKVSKNAMFILALALVEHDAFKKRYRGYSTSRLTKERLSSDEYSMAWKGTNYVWPDGYSDHYLKAGIAPTVPFVKFVIGKLGNKLDKTKGS